MNRHSTLAGSDPRVLRQESIQTGAFTRRSLLWGGAAAALGGLTSTAVARAPKVHVRRRPRLRVLGTHVTLQEPIRKQAEADLGIDLAFHPGGSAEVLHRAATRPETFDVYEQWSNSIDILWQAGAIQGIDSDRIAHWEEVNPLCKQGRLVADSPLGAGAVPARLLYAQTDGGLSSRPSRHLSFVPYVHNVDSFGYHLDSVSEGVPYETESWGWLLEPKWTGRVGIVNEPTIGLFDLALACQAKGWIEFDDIGEIRSDELDELFELLVARKRDGHFHAFWNSVPHSIDLMRSGRVVIQSMFSPAISSLRGAGEDVIYAAPREGYRAWHGVLCLSSKASEEAQEAAYAYMNWWLSGWPGAFVARQGYYISTPERSRDYLSSSEWDYWYGGQPARERLRNTDGEICVRMGNQRRGGTYEKRLSNVAVWNTVMDTYEYSLAKWYSLLSA